MNSSLLNLPTRQNLVRTCFIILRAKSIAYRSVIAILAMVICCAAAQSRTGPSFPCPQKNDAVARLICSDDQLAEMDFSFAQAFFSYRQTLRLAYGEDGGKRANKEDGVFLSSVRLKCGLPPPVRESQDAQDFPNAKSCVYAAYEAQRDAWRSYLNGPAHEEAIRVPLQHIAIQGRLRDLGYLPQTAIIDGIYGPATRHAITTWQSARGLPQTSFMSEGDANRLLAQTTLKLETVAQQPAAKTIPPVSEVMLSGPKAEQPTAPGACPGQSPPRNATEAEDIERLGCVPPPTPANVFVPDFQAKCDINYRVCREPSGGLCKIEPRSVVYFLDTQKRLAFSFYEDSARKTGERISYMLNNNTLTMTDTYRHTEITITNFMGGYVFVPVTMAIRSHFVDGYAIEADSFVGQDGIGQCEGRPINP